jgi:hypothetical protein
LYTYVKYWKDGAFLMEFSRDVIVNDVKTAFVNKQKEIEQEIYNLRKKKELLSIAFRYQGIFDNQDILNDIQYFEIIGITKEELQYRQKTMDTIEANIVSLKKKYKNINDLVEELC